jgi:hypothetical protein
MYRTKVARENLASGRHPGVNYSPYLYGGTGSEREWADEGQGIIRVLDNFDLSAFAEVNPYLPLDMKVVAEVGFINRRGGKLQKIIDKVRT